MKYHVVNKSPNGRRGNMSESSLYKAGEFLSKIVILNLYWLIMTLLGFVVFGIFPASVALAQNISDLRSGKSDVLTWSNFYKLYKEAFVKVNIVSYSLVILIVLFAFNSYFFSESIVILSCFFIMACTLVVSQFMIYLFTARRYSVKIVDIFRNSFIMVFIKPLTTLKVLIIMMFFLFLYYFFPILIIVFGISIPFWILSINYQNIYKILDNLETV